MRPAPEAQASIDHASLRRAPAEHRSPPAAREFQDPPAQELFAWRIPRSFALSLASLARWCRSSIGLPALVTVGGVGCVTGTAVAADRATCAWLVHSHLSRFRNLCI